MNSRLFVAYSLIIVAWGSAFPGIKTALQSYSPEHLALFRLMIGSISLIIFAIIKKIKLPDFKDIPVILLLGFLGFMIYHTALSMGEKTVSAGMSSLLVSTTPIFSAILAALFLKEKFNKMRWIGSLIAFCGIVIISFGSGIPQSAYVKGVIFILIAALGESFYFIFQTNFLKKYGFIPFTIYTIIAGTLFMLIFLPGLGKEIAAASYSATFSVIYLGLVPTVLSYLAMAFVTEKAGALAATSSLYLTPVAALVISWIFLNEVPTWVSLVGGIMTLVGVSVSGINLKKYEDGSEMVRKSV
ncbi:DMT family transporter [Bacillus sp. MUM 116]|uniref:DMT family transporter n=1 Tax=Bacillus sp. MUM 116 TaxID=1678002 RepID=UPI000A75BFF3|nr:DMT family transporter [Bacillus sp. MUM 116]